MAYEITIIDIRFLSRAFNIKQNTAGRRNSADGQEASFFAFTGRILLTHNEFIL
jgi:hypothetical protein